jgi:hypothetical protein
MEEIERGNITLVARDNFAIDDAGARAQAYQRPDDQQTQRLLQLLLLNARAFCWDWFWLLAHPGLEWLLAFFIFITLVGGLTNTPMAPARGR